MPLCNKQLHEMSIENTYVSPAWLKVCRACSREYHRKHRANNIESHRRRQRKWKKNNPEKVRESNRRWRASASKDVKVKRAKSTNIWKEVHPDKNAEYCKRYRDNNPEAYKRSKRKSPHKRRANEHRRRVRETSQLGDWKPEYEALLLQEQHGCCYYCQIPFQPNYDLEHKIPLSRGGMHDISNIVLSCRSCNVKKGIKTDEEFICQKIV